MSGAAPFPPRPGPARRARLRAQLLAWYRAERRDLSWRRTRDPYAIWISEAMLQQTRVQTVERYWARFLERFPDAAALARAPEEEVLAAWSGLGYYRRARSLHAAARALVEQHGGRFPRERAALLALPGIGRYTAGALLSIAFDAPEALVDGNVERVLARLFALDAPAGSPALARECWALAELLVPRAGAGDWNQALMELGATLCTPAAPDCGRCPLARACRARRAGNEQLLPRPKARRASVAVELELLVVRRGAELLLERRPDEGRMAGLWQLPTRELAPAAAPRLFPAQWPRDGSGRALLEAGAELGRLRHAITHHRIAARLLSGRLARGSAARLGAGMGFFGEQERARLALSGMARKALAALASNGRARAAE